MDILRYPTFPEKQLEVLKKQFNGAYKTARERVKYLAQVEMNKLCYGETHPLVNDVTDEVIDAVSVADLEEFHKKYLCSKNMQVILSGQITDEILEGVKTRLESIEVGGESEVAEVCEMLSSGEKFRIKDKSGAVQAAISMVLPTINRDDKDYIKLRILITA